MEFELGQTYSGYKFLDVAKRSRSGVEYRVQNTLAQRMELLKVLPSSARDDQEETERFMREMRVRAKLVHPNIVTFFTAMPLEGRLVMTTELVEGLPLSERLQLGPMSWREAADFAHQMLAAVDCAHQQQIVHRDISPDNIIAIPGGVVKLTNFRLAKSMLSLHLTQSGAIVGSLKYISPEQVKGTEALDHRSDLYSIGIVLYEMLAGRTPFNSPSQFELMLAHVNQQPEPASKFNATVPSKLDAVVLKALAKFPLDRYQSAVEFDEALARAVAEMAPAMEPAAPQPPAMEPEAPVTSLEASLLTQAAPEPIPTIAVELPPDIQPESVAAPVLAEVAAEVALEPVAAVAVDLPPAVEPDPEPILAPAIVAPAMAEVPPEPVVAATELPAALKLEPVSVPAVAAVDLEPVMAGAELPEVLELELAAVSAAAAVALEPVVEAAELPELEPVTGPAEAAVALEPVVAAAELPEILELELNVTAAVEVEPELVVAAAELAPAIEPEFVAVPATAAAAPEPVSVPAELALEPEPVAAAAESKPDHPQFDPELLAALAAPSMPAPVLLPETAIYASLWTAAEVVSRAAQAPAAQSFELAPVFAESRPVPGETVRATAVVPAAAAVVAVLSEAAAPNAAPVSQPAPAESAPTRSPYATPGFRAAAKARSESIQWAVFGGTAAFLGIVWTAIWLITGK